MSVTLPPVATSNESIDTVIAVTSSLVAEISEAKSEDTAEAYVSNESIDASASASFVLTSA